MLCLAVIAAFAEPAEPPLAIPVTEPAPSAEPPLAIPADPPPTPPARRLGERGPDRSPELAAKRVYARKLLTVRPTSEIVVGAAPAMGWGYGWGWGWGYGWGWAPTAYPVARWDVFEGGARLDVPTALDRFGDADGRAALERVIRRKRTWGNVGYGVGVAGAVTGLVGLVGLDAARTWEDATTWSQVATGGFANGALGWIAGAFPHARASRLATDPSLTWTEAQAADLADAANERLRLELGLPAEVAYDVEAAARPPR